LKRFLLTINNGAARTGTTCVYVIKSKRNCSFKSAEARTGITIMGSTTYTWTNASGGDWDTSTNWSVDGTPTSPTYAGNRTTTQDSFLFGPGTSVYTSVFSELGSDQVYDLTINGANATVLASPGGELNIADAIAVQAGTLDLGNGGELTYLSSTGSTQSFVVNGILQGAGFVDTQDPAITGTGTIIAVNDGSGTELYLGSAVGVTPADTLTVQVQAGAAVEFQTSVASGVTVNVGAGGSVLLDDLPDFHATVSGLNVATGVNTSVPSGIGSLDLRGVNSANITGVSLSGGTITIDDPTDGNSSINLAGNYTGDSVSSTPDAFGGTSLFLDDTVCFAAGTHILTPGGNVPVEAIAAGDTVVALVNGCRVVRPVKWVGYRRLALDQHPTASGLAPVRIRRGAMAEGLPARDLLVSPPHCLFIDGKLIPAKLLVNDMTIVRDTALKSVAYYHIELDSHAILIAEGIETESYLDTGNRAFFSNAGLALILHPEFHVNAGLRCWATDACAPLAVSPAAVLPVWRALADRAVALGFLPPAYATTQEADIHLVADGRRIEPIAVKGGVHSFMVPAGVTSLALASRSVVPNVLARFLDDPRRIGVAVRGVTIRGTAGRAEFAADHPDLMQGWHAPERADGALWRWTNGHGTLPAGAVAGTGAGAVVIDVTVSETTTYLLDDVTFKSRAAA
jgi:hypothetical protein